LGKNPGGMKNAVTPDLKSVVQGKKREKIKSVFAKVS